MKLHIKLLPVLLLAAVIMLPSCRRDRPVDPAPPLNGGGGGAQGFFKLRLVPEWEGQPFQPFVEHANVSGYRMQVEMVRFYLGDLRLMSNGTATQFAPVELIDLNDGPVELVYSMASGSWNGLKMGLGLPPDLNATDPATVDNEHPLSVDQEMYWTWTTGYVFTKFQGRFDTDPASSGPFPTVFSIHTGLDTAYAEMELEPLLPVVLTANDTTTITLKVAIDRFFHSEAGGTIDLASENMSHGGNVPLSLKLTRNIIESIHLE